MDTEPSLQLQKAECNFSEALDVIEKLGMDYEISKDTGFTAQLKRILWAEAKCNAVIDIFLSRRAICGFIWENAVALRTLYG